MSSAAPSEAGPTSFTDGKPLPKLIVFDLDYTLWPFWVDTHVESPIKSNDGGKTAVDRTGESFSFYDDIPDILKAARSVSLPLALASRTHAPDLATKMLKLLQIPQTDGSPSRPAFEYFDHQQIYPGDKRTHMKRLNKATKVEYSDILFFDDETRNRNVEELGVCFWLVRSGVSNAAVDDGVKEWRKRNQL